MTAMPGRRTLLFGAATALMTGASPLAVLRLGDQKGGLEALLDAAGELRDLPYRLEIAQFVAAAPLLEALNAGAIDVAAAGDAPTTFALANGAPARIVSAHRSNGAGTALLVPPDSPLRSVSDLHGRRIATGRGSIGHALVLSLLRRAGMPLNAVRFAFLLPADGKVALLSGAVDAWSSWGVYVAQARLVDGWRVLADGSDGVLSGVSYLSALDTAILARRAALRDLVARAARARSWALANVDAYARAWSAQVGTSFAVARDAFATAPTEAVPITEDIIAEQQRITNLYVEAGVLPRHVDVRGFFDLSFNDALPA
jgi:sulfonate transport system substrate-binding protein